MGHIRFLAAGPIVAGRILLATIAAAAAVFALAHSDRAVRVAGAKSYVCPMHPEVTSPAPGTCPICRMNLVPKAGRSTDLEGSAASLLRLGNVSTELRAFDAVSRVKRFATSLEMRAPAWAESSEIGVALFHRDQSRLIKPGEAALFSVSSAGSERGEPASVAVHATDQPPERWDEATDLVRFRVDSGAQLEPNQTGLVKFATRLRNDLVIRESAVRDSPDGPYVLVTSNDRHTLSKRPVEIGSRLYDYAAVISGLAEGEYVVAKHAFALDAERRFGSATQ
jgi:hypothetical protein